MHDMPIDAWNKHEILFPPPAGFWKTSDRPAVLEACLTAFLEKTDNGVVVLDAEGYVERINPAAERLTGWSRAEVQYRSVTQVLQFTEEPARLVFTNRLQTADYRRDREHLPLSVVLRARSGQEFPVELQICALDPETCHPFRFLILLRDLTDKQALEHLLFKLGRLESIDLLAGGIAHDFNNLLVGMLANLGLARSSLPAPEAAMERLAEAENAVLRAKHLTQQLLTLSKGGAPLRRLVAVDRELIEAAAFALHGSNVRCDQRIPEDLWPVEVDLGQIGQVMQNLIINAEQAMPHGGTITISCENVTLQAAALPELPAGNYVKISVADQGAGIPPDHLDRIFDLYFTTKPNGSGLGLATSREIVKRHAGTIRVDSRPGEGATFTIFLPASAKPLPCQTAPEVEEPPASGGGRILLMDDETYIQELIGEMLESVGYEVELADDGAAALERYKAAMTAGRPFDAVIMDLTIPGGMGGKQAIQELLMVDPNVKGIVSSGYPDDPVMTNYQEYGFKSCIAKPYKFKELHQMIQEVISG
jgi:PAS domain S-box-containing protein